MNYQQSLDYILSFKVMGKKNGLENMRILLDLLGNPQNNLKFIHIAGTNGKGSTTTMISSILRNSTQQKLKIGTFISPYIIDFRERIQVQGQMISQKDLIIIVGKIKQAIDKMQDPPTIFEITTAIAMYYYNEQNCDIVCLEVGLGGRFDATNVITKSLLSIITVIDLDHTQILGNSIQEIAFEKCGILKQNGTAIIYPYQHESALEVINKQSIEKNVKLIIANNVNIKIIELNEFYTVGTYNNLEFKLSLAGKHQIYNLMTAISAIQELNNIGYNISDQDIIAGINNTKFPARLELVSENPKIIIDGVHNPSGALVLKKYIEDIVPSQEKILIFGILSDKDYQSVSEILFPLFSKIIITSTSSERSLDMEKLFEISSKYNKNIFLSDNIQNAIDIALQKYAPNSYIFICGSLYLVADARKYIKQNLNK